MPFTVTMPKLSPTMEEGTIARWLKKEGDYVDAGDAFVEIATDKATVEHAALDEGYLRKICVESNQSAKVNQPIAVFTIGKDESIEGYQPEGIEMEQVEEVAAVATKKEATPTTASAPLVAPLNVPRHVPEPPLKKYDHPSPSEPPGERILASPLAKQLAKKMGLDLKTVQGTGPGGRITSQDLEKAQPEGIVTFGRSDHPNVKPGSYKEIPLSPMRKVIAQRLQESKSFIPHFYVRQVVHVDHLVSLREQLKNLDLKVSFNDLVIRAVALALRKYPEVNAGFNSVNNTIIHYKTVDISVAVTVDEGLITPIIRHADFKNVGQISSEVKSLAKKAREGKLQEHEYKGGSFTISNLGMYGITEFTAVINPPQAAILSVGAIEEQPVVKNGKVVVGNVMTLVLSADHRVIDGALGAQFLKSVQHLIQNPVGLTL